MISSICSSFIPIWNLNETKRREALYLCKQLFEKKSKTNMLQLNTDNTAKHRPLPFPYNIFRSN